MTQIEQLFRAREQATDGEAVMRAQHMIDEYMKAHPDAVDASPPPPRRSMRGR